MATKKTTTEVDPARATSIAKRLHGLAAEMSSDFAAIDTAQSAIDTAKEQLSEQRDESNNSKRMTQLTKAAAMATEGSWSIDDIKAASKEAKRMSFGDKASSTLDVFVSELKCVVHPAVRTQFQVIRTSCEEAWEAEKQLPDDQPTPIRNYKARLYALIIDICRNARKYAADKDSNRRPVIKTSKDVFQYCLDRDSKTNVDRVAARCRSLAKLVLTMHEEFHYEPFKQIAKYLTTEELASALENARLKFESELRAQAAKLKAENTAKAADGIAQNAKPALVKKTPSMTDVLKAAVAATKATEPEPDADDEDNEPDDNGVASVDELLDDAAD